NVVEPGDAVERIAPLHEHLAAGYGRSGGGRGRAGLGRRGRPRRPLNPDPAAPSDESHAGASERDDRRAANPGSPFRSLHPLPRPAVRVPLSTAAPSTSGAKCAFTSSSVRHPSDVRRTRTERWLSRALPAGGASTPPPAS